MIVNIPGLLKGGIMRGDMVWVPLSCFRNSFGPVVRIELDGLYHHIQTKNSHYPPLPETHNKGWFTYHTALEHSDLLPLNIPVGNPNVVRPVEITHQIETEDGDLTAPITHILWKYFHNKAWSGHLFTKDTPNRRNVLGLYEILMIYTLDHPEFELWANLLKVRDRRFYPELNLHEASVVALLMRDHGLLMEEAVNNMGTKTMEEWKEIYT
jgi:hypothetical protein